MIRVLIYVDEEPVIWGCRYSGSHFEETILDSRYGFPLHVFGSVRNLKPERKRTDGVIGNSCVFTCSMFISVDNGDENGNDNYNDNKDVDS